MSVRAWLSSSSSFTQAKSPRSHARCSGVWPEASRLLIWLEKDRLVNNLNPAGGQILFLYSFNWCKLTVNADVINNLSKRWIILSHPIENTIKISALWVKTVVFPFEVAPGVKSFWGPLLYIHINCNESSCQCCLWSWTHFPLISSLGQTICDGKQYKEWHFYLFNGIFELLFCATVPVTTKQSFIVML